MASWKAFFEDKEAPFSYESAEFEVLDSGAWAHSNGPVHARGGKRVGTFNSIWRREADGTWKVIFDKGCGARTCASAQ
ncbi:MAG: hypothetical protein ACT4O5_16105 [Gammaproteobacteria bacterium]